MNVYYTHTSLKWAYNQKSWPELWYTTYCRGPLGVLKKHFAQFWELNFEALEADGGQNAPETSGEVGLSWEWSRKIPGKILTYLDIKKGKIRQLYLILPLFNIICNSSNFGKSGRI